jgi:alpha-1,6-mannosyltransferase
VSTALGVGAGEAGLLLGLGDHIQAALDVMQPVGTVIGSVIAVAIMWQCWQRRINPVLGLGMAMGAFVLLAPVIQPWYLLWAALPLAASTADPRYRKATIWLTVLFSVTIMPNGATIPVYVIVQAVVVAAVVVGGVFYSLRRSGLPRTPSPGSVERAVDPPVPGDAEPIPAGGYLQPSGPVTPDSGSPPEDESAISAVDTNATTVDGKSGDSATYPRS